jgi:FkbM family methyltransferase
MKGTGLKQFFGGIRRKILRILFGNELINNIAGLPQMNVKIQEIDDNVRTIDKTIENKHNELINSIASLPQMNVKIQEIDDNVRTIDKTVKKIQKNIWNIKNRVPSLEWYSHLLEREELVNTGFYDVIESRDFQDSYFKLIHGLDFSSIEIVNDIISKIRKVKDSVKKMDLFSNDEKEHIRFLKDNFYSKIFQISSTVWSYRHYLLPIEIFDISVFFNKHCIDKIENLGLIKNRDIIDAGAYVGDSAIVLSECTSKNVYSFEAVSENFELMLKTIKINDRKNIVPINMALGSQNKYMEIMVADRSFKSTFDEQLNKNRTVSRKESVKVTTLDSYVEENGLDVGLIKTDVEGFETQLLQGAYNTIKKCLPVLIISIYHSGHDFFNIKPMIESWNLGYSFQVYKPRDDRIRTETVLICEVKPAKKS